jgi:uncharacterized iron-regulated membrane protein
MGLPSFYKNPRTSRVRKVLFQVHLWLGAGLGLYAALIGLTGSILVFRPEMQATGAICSEPSGSTRISAEAAANILRRAHPDLRLLTFIVPQADCGLYSGWLFGGSESILAHVHPETGRVLPTDPSAMKFWNVVSALHVSLLSGAIGHVWNGVLALITLVVLLSGAVLWWQGVRRWTRGLNIQFGARWARLNWDIHSAAGFWSLPALLLITLSGIYFIWPQPFRVAASAFGGLSQRGGSPKVYAAGSTKLASLDDIIAAAKSVRTKGRPGRINLSDSPSKAIRVVLYEEGFSAHHKYGYLFLHPVTLEVLRADLRETRTTADSLIAWLPALHFGSFAGLPSRVLWFAFGLTFPLLFVTGLLMWWNRRCKNTHLSAKRSVAAQRAPDEEQSMERLATAEAHGHPRHRQLL